MASQLSTDRATGDAELVQRFPDQMPTGVTVADDGRIFVCYPRWGDRVEFTVAELRGGKEVPYPAERVNVYDPHLPGECLVSVQSVVVDPAGRLWCLDTGSIEFGEAIPNGPKLVCVDLSTDEIVQTIHLPRDVALPTTYLNDVRFDLRRGGAGLAFVTDSGDQGPNGLVVVDLDTGRSWRKLTGHETVRAVPGYMAIIEGRPVPGIQMGSDGIAISNDGERLFYCPLASRRLYSVAVDALADPDLGDDEVAATIVDHGEKGSSDGLESDAEGRIYATNYEQGAVLAREPDGSWREVAHGRDHLFVDTLAVAADGFIYYTVNQLHRQAAMQPDGEDRREPPYAVMRTRIDAAPVRLVR